MTKRLLRAVASVASVGALVLFYRLLIHVNDTTVALSFLLLVLLAAAGWGLTESIAASIAAVLCLNYFFLPPVGTWTISDPENWVALLAFLVTSIIASELSATARGRALEAVERQRETEQLYTLNRTILLTSGTVGAVARQTASSIAHIFEIPSVLLYDDSTGAVFWGGEERPVTLDRVKQVGTTGLRREVEEGIILPLSLGGKPIGALGVFGADLADAPLNAMANLAAIAMERAQTQDLASRTEITRRQEEFKSSLLDALAHEFKTPLTAIAAAASAVASSEGLSQPDRELMQVVVQETSHLDALVTETVKMAQIDAGKARLNREPVLLRTLVDETLARLSTVVEGRTIKTALPDDLWVEADRELVEVALKQLVDNALKYSPTSSTVEVSANLETDHVRVCVADSGAGIDELEQQQIFEKYYRGATSSGLPKGTGLGLSVARDIIVAHGGKVWVESVRERGSRFYFTLPWSRSGKTL